MWTQLLPQATSIKWSLCLYVGVHRSCSEKKLISYACEQLLNGKWFYLYCASLVLDGRSKRWTVQVLHPPIFTHTHSYTASICSTFLYQKGQIQGSVSCLRTLRYCKMRNSTAQQRSAVLVGDYPFCVLHWCSRLTPVDESAKSTLWLKKTQLATGCESLNSSRSRGLLWRFQTKMGPDFYGLWNTDTWLMCFLMKTF